MKREQISSSRSRRNFLQLSAGAATAAAIGLRIVGEAELARADSRPFPKDAVMIDSNENPLGPCRAACEAVANVAPQGGRYSRWMMEDLTKCAGTMDSSAGLRLGHGVIHSIERIATADWDAQGGLHDGLGMDR